MRAIRAPVAELPSPKVDDDRLLGQFIPIHYHFQMLMDPNRMGPFKAAIEYAVKPGSRVLELGGGTGVLSFFAAQNAARVYCVERLSANVAGARRFLERNGVSDRVTVVQADAFEYLPPEPVDVVICEMLHSAMLREKQIPVIAAFKKRYLRQFGAPLPLFLPEGLIMGVQPIEQSYNFYGYDAPVPMFSDGGDGRTRELGPPVPYALFQYADDFSQRFEMNGALAINAGGELNALRFITKNVLSIVVEEQRSIDWNMHHFIAPLASPISVRPGETAQVQFAYEGGDNLSSLLDSMNVTR